MQLRVYGEYFCRLCRMINITKDKEFYITITPTRYMFNILTAEDQLLTFEVIENQVINIEDISVNSYSVTTYFELSIQLESNLIDYLKKVKLKDSKKDIIFNYDETNINNEVTEITSEFLDNIYKGRVDYFKLNKSNIEQTNLYFYAPDFIENVLNLITESPQHLLKSIYLKGKHLIGIDSLATNIALTELTNISKEDIEYIKDIELVILNPNLVKSIFSDIKVEHITRTNKLRYMIENNLVSLAVCASIKISKSEIFYFDIIFKHNKSKLLEGKYNLILDTSLGLKELIIKTKPLNMKPELIQSMLDKISLGKQKEAISIKESKLALEDFTRLFSKFETISKINVLEHDLNSFLMVQYSSVYIITTLSKKVQK